MTDPRGDRPSRAQIEAMRRRVAERVNPGGRYVPMWDEEKRDGK